jgi:hypothetical protein
MGMSGQSYQKLAVKWDFSPPLIIPLPASSLPKQWCNTPFQCMIA